MRCDDPGLHPPHRYGEGHLGGRLMSWRYCAGRIATTPTGNGLRGTVTPMSTEVNGTEATPTDEEMRAGFKEAALRIRKANMEALVGALGGDLSTPARQALWVMADVMGTSVCDEIVTKIRQPEQG